MENTEYSLELDGRKLKTEVALEHPDGYKVDLSIMAKVETHWELGERVEGSR
jgi:hypothetical protein